MRYAVSHIDWYDHDLITVLVEADTWQAALAQHPKMAGNDLSDLPATLEEAKTYFFDQDAMIEITPIP